MQKRITWVCSQCGGSVTDGCTVDNEENLVCYQCCAVQDHEYMLEHGVIDVYLTKRSGGWAVENWPGTLIIPVARISEGTHNIAGIQRQVWFRYEGEN